MKILEKLKHAFVIYCENAKKSGLYRVTGDCSIY